MKKCKNCQLEGYLEPIKDFKWQFDTDDPIVLINGFKCSNCEAIYSFVDGSLDFWSFNSTVKDDDKFKAVNKPGY